ncbi:MAG: hypothetical protein DSY87_05240 [Methylococcus sp.]|jgi:hypothetical protein|nr:MAG: hypothetical protein DSY87_05240 [Methylococcus sp.]
MGELIQKLLSGQFQSGRYRSTFKLENLELDIVLPTDLDPVRKGNLEIRPGRLRPPFHPFGAQLGLVKWLHDHVHTAHGQFVLYP